MRLTNPKICSQQAGDPGELMVWSQSKSKPKGGRRQCASSKTGRERTLLNPAFLFCWGLRGVYEATHVWKATICTHFTDPSVNSSRSTLTHVPRSNV